MMEIRSIFTDDRAVSPVIGVILMVAITVILAAVIGALVLDMGSSPGQSAPTMSVDAEGSPESTYTLTHAGGDVINNDLSVRYTSYNATGSNDTASATEPWNAPIDAGSSFETNESVASDSTIRIVWTSDDGSEQHIIQEIEVP